MAYCTRHSFTCTFCGLKLFSEFQSIKLLLHIRVKKCSHTLFLLFDCLCRANSVTWNPHKMMGVPLQCSAILVRERVRQLSGSVCLHH